MITRFIIVCLCLFILPVQAMACSCTEESFTSEASQKNITRAALIFTGEVLEVKDSEDIPYFSEIKISLDKLHKGGGGEVGEVNAFADTATSCGTTHSQIKKQTFFMLYTHKGQYVVASGCGNYISQADRTALERGEYLPKE